MLMESAAGAESEQVSWERRDEALPRRMRPLRAWNLPEAAPVPPAVETARDHAPVRRVVALPVLLPQRDLASFSASARTQIYAQGPLPQPEHPLGVISFIEQGSVRLYRVTAEGRQLTVGIRQAGDYVLQISTGAVDVPLSCVEALVNGTLVHRFPRPRLDLLVARHPALAQALIDDLSRHLGEAYDRLEDAALRPTDIQLAHTLALLPRVWLEVGWRRVGQQAALPQAAKRQE